LRDVTEEDTLCTAFFTRDKKDKWIDQHPGY